MKEQINCDICGKLTPMLKCRYITSNEIRKETMRAFLEIKNNNYLHTLCLECVAKYSINYDCCSICNKSTPLWKDEHGLIYITEINNEAMKTILKIKYGVNSVHTLYSVCDDCVEKYTIFSKTMKFKKNL